MRSPGFTLLEVIVVLVIGAAAYAILLGVPFRGASIADLKSASRTLAAGLRQAQSVALATRRFYEMGSDCVEAVNAIAGERCSPHPHNFTDRLIRPGDQAYFDIIQSFMGYRTCYYRTFAVGRASPAQIDAYKKAREWMDGAGREPAGWSRGVRRARLADARSGSLDLGCSRARTGRVSGARDRQAVRR